MQPIQQGNQRRGHLGIPLLPGGAQAAAGGAGIIDGMFLLGGAFRVDPQSHAFPRRPGPEAEFFQLAGGIEHDVVRIPQNFFKIPLPVAGAEHMDLLPRHLLRSQPGLKQAAGLRSIQVGRHGGIQVKVGKGLLRQEHFGSGFLRHRRQQRAVFQQLPLIQNIGRGGYFCKQLGGVLFSQAPKGRAVVNGHGEPPFSWKQCLCGNTVGLMAVPRRRDNAVIPQSTSTGLWLSLRGRPCLSRASRKGSGSNSSTVCTPGAVHLPVSSIMAPHMAGTPVV